MKVLSFISSILLFGLGCSSTLHPWRQFNRIQHDWTTDFWNDTAKIHIQWTWDFHFYEVPPNDILRRHIEVYSDLFEKKHRVKWKNMLLVGETIVDYRFYASLVFVDTERLSAGKLMKLGFSPDNNGNFSKTHVSEHPKYCAVIKLYPYGKSWLAMLGFTLDKDIINPNSWYAKDVEDLFAAKALKLQIEFFGLSDDWGLFNQVKYGQNYAGFRTLNPFTWALDLFQTRPDGNYYLPVVQLLAAENNYESMVDKDIFYQALLTYNSFLHDDSLQEVYLRKKFRTDQTEILTADCITGLESVKQSIVDSARHARVVFFNESHYAPQHRYLVSACLEDLFEVGYRYLALECLEEAGDSLAARGFPVIQSGLYSRESQMANLIRNALRIGYKLVSYDSFGPDRERKQAQNIFERTFAVDPSARVVVLGGWSHIDEDSTKGRMAHELKAITQFDPLTINQTNLYPFYEILESRVGLIPSQDLKRHDVRARDQCDFYVVNNLNSGDFRVLPSASVHDSEYTIDLSSAYHESCKSGVLLIYSKGEHGHPNALPVVAAKLSQGQSQYRVRLPKGHYAAAVESYRGRLPLPDFGSAPNLH